MNAETAKFVFEMVGIGFLIVMALAPCLVRLGEEHRESMLYIAQIAAWVVVVIALSCWLAAAGLVLTYGNRYVDELYGSGNLKTFGLLTILTLIGFGLVLYEYLIGVCIYAAIRRRREARGQGCNEPALPGDEVR